MLFSLFRNKSCVLEIDGDFGVGGDIFGYHFPCNERFNRRADKALQGARAVDRVVCSVDDLVLCGIGDAYADTLLGKALGKRAQSEVYYPADILLR